MLRNRKSTSKKKVSAQNVDADFRLRVMILASALAMAGTLMLARYAQLAVLPTELNEKLRTRATKQFESEVTLLPPRAKIVDRSGRTLAVSVLQPSLFAIPKRLPSDRATLEVIAKQIKIPLNQLLELKKSKKGFAWLRRHVPPQDFENMGDLHQWREFIGIAEEPKRIYPEKDVAAHLLGFVGIDNNGLEGVEAIFNSKLNGNAQIAKVTRDARGHITLTVPNGAVMPETQSQPLALSIDLSIQSAAEIALKEGVLKAKARAGSAVVMDVETGELLAIASYPSFDLNNPSSAQPEAKRFRPLMDALELGSVVKPLFIARAIDKKKIRPDEKFFCENGSMQVPGGKIRDTHPHGMLTPAEVIKVSSNICTYKIVQRLGRNGLYDSLGAYGLTRTPGTGLPGEWAGRVQKPEAWREMRFANMAFGQGLAISPLQMTRAMAILTGGGTDPGIGIVSREKMDDDENLNLPPLRVISESTSQLVTNMMRGVVEEEGGTGRLASIAGIAVAGKTGTAQKYDPKTRSYSERIATFTGVLPADHPRLAITVVIDEPQVRPAYGGVLAGPVFSDIGHKAINYLNSRGLIQLDPTTPSQQDNSLAKLPKRGEM
ncbi:MAG: peptidoglycan D,D-transpeptidase FtsI family protein [Silvanigrellaceae bacterium]